MSPIVVLVGPPGAGKTTVAALVSESLGVASRDTDIDVEATAGQVIADLFVDHGEQHFRDLEARAVALALAEHHGVLALGGGAVLRDATRAALQDQAVVFLDVDLTGAASRVGLNTARPVLLGNVRSQMKALLEHRRPLYAQVARHVVHTDGISPEEVADQVVAWLKGVRDQEVE